VAVILFGFAIGFGTYVAMSEHDSAKARWRSVETARHIDEAHAGSAPDGEHDEAKGSPASTLTSPSTNPLVALLKQQIDSARMDDATDAAHAKNVKDPLPRHGKAPRIAPGAVSPGTSLASGDSAHQPSRQQLEVQAAPAPARCGREGAAPCKTASRTVDSHSETHHIDKTGKSRSESVIKNVQDTLPSRFAMRKHGTQIRPIERVASVPPRRAPRRTHPRPHVETAQRRRQTQVPLPGQPRHLWRFEMPRADRRADLSQIQLELYRGH
jgi:hypothetical protein